MDVIGMGLVTQSEIAKIMAPSINKSLKRTIDRKKMLSDRDSQVILQNKTLNQALRLEPIRLNVPQPVPLAVDS